MDDLRRYGPRFKSPSAFVVGGAVTVNSIERECKCGHFDEPTLGGFCRSDDCRHDRFVKALLEGKAVKLKNGTIVWNVE